MSKSFSIAIDGPAGAGKSTIAKALARELGAMYLDTGAMYRAIGLHMLRKGLVDDPDAVAANVNDVDIEVRHVDGVQRIFLSGEDVSEAIRQPEVSMVTSTVSAIPAVRARLVALQQQIAEGHDVIMDGRDIGTAVLPNATLKIYLTASAEVRARRRCDELQRKGTPQPYADVLKEMEARDWRDTHREASPLRPADDAKIVDTSDMDQDAVVETLRRMALEVIS